MRRGKGRGTRVNSRTTLIGGEQRVRVTFVNAEGIFNAALPTNVATALGRTEVTGKTLDEMEHAWAEAKAEFETHVTTKRKVIVYGFQMSACLFAEAEDGSRYGRQLINRSEISFTDGVALDMWVGVFEETARTYRSYTRFSYDSLPSSIPVGFGPRNHDWRGRGVEQAPNLFDWTAEREEWFAGLCRAYSVLLVKLATLFKDEATLLLAMNEPLMLSAGKEG